ncbi:hypothetical protein ACW14Y_04980 [Kitasatospora sp. cg17-2]
MSWWAITLPTVQWTGAGPVTGTQTWFLTSDSPERAAELALSRAQSPDCVRHRRGAALVPDRMTCAPLSYDGSGGFGS